MIKKYSYRLGLLSILKLFLITAVHAQFTNNGAVITISSDAQLHIDGSVILNSGAVLNHEGTLSFTGDWFNQNVGKGCFAESNQGRVIMTGADQYILGNYSSNFPHLILQGTGEKYLGGSQTLNRITLNDRLLFLDTFTLSIADRNVNGIETTGGFFVTDSTKGGVNLNTGSTDWYFVPVGYATNTGGDRRFYPVSIQPSVAAANTYNIGFVYKNPNSMNMPVDRRSSTILQMNTEFSHRISALSNPTSPSPINMRFYSTNAEEDYDGVAVWNNEETAKNWDDISPTPPSSDAWGRYLEKTGWVGSNNKKHFLFIGTTIGDTTPREPLVFQIANVVTVGNDDKNDYWQIRGIENYPDNEVRIVDAWGTEVFRRKNYTNANGWRAENVSAGTYYYILRINEGLASNTRLTGYITVLK